MPRILSFDTSSEACSVCVLDAGLPYSDSELKPRQHAQCLLPMIKNLLTSRKLSLTDIDAIAFSRGPGSFTGLRIAAGVAQGLSYGSNCGVLAISNLEAMAWQAAKETDLDYVLAVIDARMDEIYYGLFEVIRSEPADCSLRLVGEERVSAPEDIQLAVESSVYAVGNGLQFVSRFPEQVQQKIKASNAEVISMAEDIAHLALLKLEAGATLLSAQEVRPTYLRDTVAWKKLPGRE